MDLGAILLFSLLRTISCLRIPTWEFSFEQDRQLTIQNSVFLVDRDAASLDVLLDLGFDNLKLVNGELYTFLVPGSDKIILMNESHKTHLIFVKSTNISEIANRMQIPLFCTLLRQVKLLGSCSTMPAKKSIHQHQTMVSHDMIVHFLLSQMRPIYELSKQDDKPSVNILLQQCRTPRTELQFNVAQRTQTIVANSSSCALFPTRSPDGSATKIEVFSEDIELKHTEYEGYQNCVIVFCRLDNTFYQCEGVEFRNFVNSKEKTTRYAAFEHADPLLHIKVAFVSETSKSNQLILTECQLTNITRLCSKVKEETIKKRSELNQVRIEGVAASDTSFLSTTITNSAETRDCVKLTWYNVLHHSVFGKPTDFCQT